MGDPLTPNPILPTDRGRRGGRFFFFRLLLFCFLDLLCPFRHGGETREQGRFRTQGADLNSSGGCMRHGRRCLSSPVGRP